MNPENISTSVCRDYWHLKLFKSDNTFKVHRNIEYVIIENGKLCIVFEDESCITESINDYERIEIV